MLRTRIIVSLLILNNRLVKTTKFQNPRYVGDPVNTVRIFNEKEVDEIMIFDIGASKNNLKPNFELISKIAEYANMPISYGGGISSIEDIDKIISSGIEKITISSSIFKKPQLVFQAARKYGSQSIAAVLDIKREGSSYFITSHSNTVITDADPLTVSKELVNLGVGEIVLNSIDLDGCKNGYDHDLIVKLSEYIKIPISILGGCGSLKDMIEISGSARPSGIAAGSFFIYKGKLDAVLPNYLTLQQKKIIDLGE